jgi:signal transduction histidine kinase
MATTDRQLPSFLSRLRWIIPTLMAALGLGYTLIEQLQVSHASFNLVYTLSKILVIGIVGPSLAYWLLALATNIARSQQVVEEALARRALQLEIASQVGQKVTAILKMDALLSQVVRLIREKFGYYHVDLLLVEAHSNEIVLRASSGQASESLKAERLRLKIGGQSITGRVAQTGRPALYNDVAQEPHYYPHELLPQTRSELAVPLKIGDVVVGVLDVQSEQCNAFGKDDETALRIVGDQVAIAIENANLFRETQRQFEAMRALHDISLDITAQLESTQVLAAILKHATHLLNAQGSALSIYDPAQDILRNLAIHNLPAEFGGSSLQVGEGLAGQVVATGKPLIVDDYPNWARRSPQFQNGPFDAAVGVPLRWQGHVIGALLVLDQRNRRPFTEHDVQFLCLFADLASIALKNAELYAQVVQFNQQLEQKVEQRTNELVRAQKVIALKAEQLRQLLAATVHIQEEERTRIAQDLHDGSNQLITGTLYEIQAAQQSILGQRAEVALKKLETAKEILRMVDAENRHIISGLRPPILDAQGLVPALKWHVDTYQRHVGIACSVRVCGRPIRLSPNVEIAVYRIVQESLNNVAAHAQARSVKIQVDFRPVELQVVVEDDGIGFDYERILATAPGRMGLIGMRERGQSIGGKIKVRSEPGRGTRIVLDVPAVTEAVPGAMVSAQK